MSNSVKLVVFDLDGTLLNTLTDLTNAVNYAVSTVGLPPYTNEQVRNMIGDGAEILLRRALPTQLHDKLEQVYHTYSQYYDSHLTNNTAPYQGIEQCLQQLRNNGIKIGVFSNKADNQVKFLCDAMLSGLVDYAIGRLHNGARKPDPFGLLQIIKESGIDKANTIFVGDSTVDIDTANNGGVRCVSVSWGYNDIDKLVSHGAKLIVSNCNELISQLNSL